MVKVVLISKSKLKIHHVFLVLYEWCYILESILCVGKLGATNRFLLLALLIELSETWLPRGHGLDHIVLHQHLVVVLFTKDVVKSIECR